MDENLAKLIFAVIMTIGFLIWLWSLQKALGLGRSREKADWRMLADDPASSADLETGSRTVRGESEQLSQALARALTQLNIGGFGPLFEITERTSRRIELKKTGP